MAFVGQLRAESRLPAQCEGSTPCWEFDLGYQLDFRVVQEFEGVGPRSRRVLNFAHGGYPQYGDFQFALVLAFQRGDSLVAAVGLPVARARSGRWVFCAEPERFPELRAVAKRVQFREPVRAAVAGPDVGTGAFATLLEMRPGVTSCAHGVDAEDLIATYRADASPKLQRIIETSSPAAQ